MSEGCPPPPHVPLHQRVVEPEPLPIPPPPPAPLPPAPIKGKKRLYNLNG